MLDTTQVEGYQDGASPCGVMDMAGNVWECMAGWLVGHQLGFYDRLPPGYPLT